jgi:hypothetical protein
MKTFLEFNNTPKDYHHIHVRLRMESFPDLSAGRMIAGGLMDPASDTTLFSPLMNGDVTILRTKDKLLNELNSCPILSECLPIHGWVTGYVKENNKLYAKLHSPKMEELHHKLLDEYDTSHYDPYLPMQEQYAPFLLVSDRWMASLPEELPMGRMKFTKKIVEPIYESSPPNYATLSW